VLDVKSERENKQTIPSLVLYFSGVLRALCAVLTVYHTDCD
jgi:hypothetical protein